MKFGEMKASRKEIVKEVAKRAGITNVLANFTFNAFSTVIEEKLREGKEVTLPYVGRLWFAQKKSQISNMTRQEIPPHKQLKFRPNRDLARYIRVVSREH